MIILGLLAVRRLVWPSLAHFSCIDAFLALGMQARGWAFCSLGMCIKRFGESRKVSILHCELPPNTACCLRKILVLLPNCFLLLFLHVFQSIEDYRFWTFGTSGSPLCLLVHWLEQLVPGAWNSRLEQKSAYILIFSTRWTRAVFSLSTRLDCQLRKVFSISAPKWNKRDQYFGGLMAWLGFYTSCPWWWWWLAAGSAFFELIRVPVGVKTTGRN